jgi:hypothetical protein
MQAYQAQTPLMYQLCSRTSSSRLERSHGATHRRSGNIAGHTKRVFAYAAMFTANGTGNAIASQVGASEYSGDAALS